MLDVGWVLFSLAIMLEENSYLRETAAEGGGFAYIVLPIVLIFYVCRQEFYRKCGIIVCEEREI